jgi:succinate dehydrogenase/fumarate reductase flavoprotein subunit
MRDWPHVVIVGGGFARLKACNALAGKPVRVTLINKRNFNLFQPLLYSGGLRARLGGRPGDSLLPFTRNSSGSSAGEIHAKKNDHSCY